MTGRFRFRSLVRKFLFWFLLVALLPLVFSAWIVTVQMTDSARENASSNLAAIRDMKVSHFRLWIREKEVNVRVLAEDSTLRNLVEGIEKGTGNRGSAIAGAREVLKKHLGLRRDFLDFFLVDRSTGMILLSTEPSYEGLNRSTDPYFKGPLEKNGTYVKDIFRSEFLGGEPSMTVSTPVYCLAHGGEHITAVLVGRVDLENSLFALLQSREGLGETGEMVLVNGDSIAINSLRDDPDAPLKRKITAEPARLAAEGGTGVSEVEDYAGKKVLAAYTHLPELGWGFVVKMDQSEVYGPIAEMVRRVLLTGFIFFVLTSVLALAVSRSLARPLKEMAEVTGRIAGGDLDARNPEGGSNDEIGSLAASVNSMASTLQARFGLLEGISQVMETMSRRLDRRGFAEATLCRLIAVTGSHMGVFYIAEDGARRLVPVFAVGLDPSSWDPIDSGRLEGILGLTSVFRDVARVGPVPEGSPFLFRGPGGVAEARELMAVPLYVTGRVLGLLCLGSLSGFSAGAEALVRETRNAVSAGLADVLSSEQVQEMTAQLQARNEELVSQSEELRQQSEELQEQNVELDHQHRMIEQANRLKSEFLSNMSHELRTPLNSILALSRVLQRKSVDEDHGEEEARYLDVIERNGRQLLDLINDILDLSKIESGRVEIRPSLFLLRDAVFPILETLAPIAVEKGITLEADIPEDLPMIRSDDARLRQILRNLLGNAVKFTFEGGVTISARIEKGEFAISVSDTGIGISEEELPHIFDEFRQADGSSSRQFEGTGLGLAIARKSALLLGGGLSAESKKGKGSVFTLRLPIELGAPYQNTIDEFISAEVLRNAVIVVEDDPAAASMISALLEKAGYEAVVARSGSDALQLARRILPVAMTLDLMMPEMDGWEVLQRMKEDPATSDIPVVIVSVCDEAETAMALGADGFLRKPVSEGDLAAEIRMVSGRDEGRVIVAGETAGGGRGGRVRRILMVEDNDIAARQVKHLIEEEGIACVDLASGGRQALDYMKEKTPDAIILDLMMPGVDGFSVLDQLRGKETTAGIPVLILTAKDLTREDLSRLRSNNVQQLVQKGDVDREELLRKVRLLFLESHVLPGDSRPDVLYIEDNPDNMTTMRAILEGEYRLAGASDGTEGLKKASALKPKVILLDLSLPDTEGFEVLEKLKEDPATKDIPVAAVTARAMKGDRRRALEAGCKAYVTKPVDPDEMRSVLERLMMS